MNSGDGFLIRFLENHAVILDEWGSIGIISGFLLLIILIFFFNAFIRKPWLKIAAISLLMALLITLTLITFLMSSPTKDFISNIAIIQKAIGAPVPDIGIIDLNNNRVYRLNNLRGHVILMNIWPGKCGSCEEESGVMKKILEENPNEIRLLTVTHSPSDSLKKFLRESTGNSIGGIYAGTAWIEPVGDRPLTIIIDSKGIVKEYFYGSKDLAFIKSKVEKYLNE